MDNLSLLAVFAHPDDESCGPGATLAKYADHGVEVALVCATKGEHGVWGADQAIAEERFASIRMYELGCACKELGIRRWAVLGYPDGGLAQCNRHALEEEIVQWVRRAQPTVVVTHWPEGPQGHPDHRTISRLATQAYLRAGDPRRFTRQMKQGLAPWQPLKLYYAVPPDPERPAGVRVSTPVTVVEATDFVEAKMEALRCHASQEECWKGLLGSLLHTSKWTESFYLAHSRVCPGDRFQDDLFDGVVAEAVLSGRSARGAQP